MKLPKAWGASSKPTQPNNKVEGTTTKVTARIDMSAEVAGAGLCPECRNPMGLAIASDVPVRSCNPCRIAIPLPDSETPPEEVPIML